jgi:hypothetical protein
LATKTSSTKTPASTRECTEERGVMRCSTIVCAGTQLHQTGPGAHAHVPPTREPCARKHASTHSFVRTKALRPRHNRARAHARTGHAHTGPHSTRAQQRLAARVHGSPTYPVHAHLSAWCDHRPLASGETKARATRAPTHARPNVCRCNQHGGIAQQWGGSPRRSGGSEAQSAQHGQ